MYLMYADLDTKKTAATKIAEAIVVYVRRFSTRPNTVLINADELLDAPIAGVTIRSEGYIRRGIFWIGWEDGAGKASDLTGATR